MEESVNASQVNGLTDVYWIYIGNETMRAGRWSLLKTQSAGCDRCLIKQLIRKSNFQLVTRRGPRPVINTKSFQNYRNQFSSFEKSPFQSRNQEIIHHSPFTIQNELQSIH